MKTKTYMETDRQIDRQIDLMSNQQSVCCMYVSALKTVLGIGEDVAK